MEYVVHFETLGCRLNQTETEGAAKAFIEEGFVADLNTITASETANKNVVLSIINTCTVTGKAEQKARRIIRLLLEKYPNAPVLVTGCYAEVDSEAIKKIDRERIAVLKGTLKHLIIPLAKYFSQNILLTAKDIELFLDKNNTITNPKVATSLKVNPFSLYTPIFKKHTRATLKVQDGCDCACTYCRIHIARGRSISIDVEEAVKRAVELEQNGAREIVLTGVNLSLYSGNTSSNTKASFGMLLDSLLANTKNVKFRISSFYPQHITENLITILSNDRIQPSFHLSVQSGSNRILELMNRPYKAQEVLLASQRLRSIKPSCFLSCDIIAGFPSETENDFNETMDLCKNINFAWIHAFPFSPRPSTPAYSMKMQIPERIKGERIKKLTDLAIKGKINYIQSLKNVEYNAIVEGMKHTNDYVHAVTDNFLHVECINAMWQNNLTYKQGDCIKIKLLDSDEESIKQGKEIEAKALIVF